MMSVQPFRAGALAVLAVALALPAIHCGGGHPSGAANPIRYPQTDIAAAVGLGVFDRPVLSGAATPPFAVEPALPDGLSLDPATGMIAGIPTGLLPATLYTVTDGNPAGTISAQVRIAVGAAGSVQYQVLNVPVVFQEHNEWCTLASCASILAYVGHPVDQCLIDDYEQNIDYACEAEPFYWDNPVILGGVYRNFGPRSGGTDALTHFGAPATGRYSALTFAQIKTEIGANRPFIVHFEWSGSDDHNLVGMGWDERNGEQGVFLMDPWITEGVREVPYAWACSGLASATENAHVWDKTTTLD